MASEKELAKGVASDDAQKQAVSLVGLIRLASSGAILPQVGVSILESYAFIRLSCFN